MSSSFNTRHFPSSFTSLSQAAVVTLIMSAGLAWAQHTTVGTPQHAEPKSNTPRGDDRTQPGVNSTGVNSNSSSNRALSPEKQRAAWMAQSKAVAKRLGATDAEANKVAAAYVESRKSQLTATQKAREEYVSRSRQENKNGQTNDGQFKDSQNRDNQNRDTQNRDSQNRDNQNRDNQNRDNLNRDNLNRDNLNRDNQNRDGQSTYTNGGNQRGGQMAQEIQKGLYESNAKERERLSKTFSTILTPSQAEMALASLGTYNRQWDIMTDQILGFNLSNDKEQKSLEAIETYIVAVETGRPRMDNINNRDGSYRDGVTGSGMNRDGINRDGTNRDGTNREGMDREGSSPNMNPSNPVPSNTSPSSTPYGTNPSSSNPVPSNTNPTSTPYGTTPSTTNPTGTNPTTTTEPLIANPARANPSKPSGLKPTTIQPTNANPSNTYPSGTNPTGTNPNGTYPNNTNRDAIREKMRASRETLTETLRGILTAEQLMKFEAATRPSSIRTASNQEGRPAQGQGSDKNTWNNDNNNNFDYDYDYDYDYNNDYDFMDDDQ